MKIEYEPWDPRPVDIQMINFINGLIENYLNAGYKLSVRQLYYQLVARDLIANRESEYKRISVLISKARMSGYMRWDAIEDRNREIVQRARWGSGKEILQSVASQFHMDMWDNQQTRVFVVVEKAALEGVLSNVCHEFDVPLLASRGYPSVSIMHDLVMDYLNPVIMAGQRIHILHLGDHDPSGVDMTRDLEERICQFITGEPYDYNNYPDDFTLERIALSLAQVRETNAPPNPAKITDPRAKGYLKRFGPSSWELDALPPEYIERLVRFHIEDKIDEEKWDERKAEIEAVRAKLQGVANRFKD